MMRFLISQVKLSIPHKLPKVRHGFPLRKSATAVFRRLAERLCLFSPATLLFRKTTTMRALIPNLPLIRTAYRLLKPGMKTGRLALKPAFQ